MHSDDLVRNRFQQCDRLGQFREARRRRFVVVYVEDVISTRDANCTPEVSTRWVITTIVSATRQPLQLVVQPCGVSCRACPVEHDPCARQRCEVCAAAKCVRMARRVSISTVTTTWTRCSSVGEVKTLRCCAESPAGHLRATPRASCQQLRHV